MTRRVFWLSFCDGDRPEGQQFLGACVIEVTEEDATAAAVDVAAWFPRAVADAEWVAAATRKAWQLGCNPGGEIATAELPADHPALAYYQRGVLMDRATIEHIDALYEADHQSAQDPP